MNSNQSETTSILIHDPVTLEQFEARFDAYLQKLKAVGAKPQLIKLISSDFRNLCLEYIKQGDAAQEFLLNPAVEVPIIESYLINHAVAEHFKSVLILHRDVLLELNKASVLSLEDLNYSDKQILHFESSKSTLIIQLETIQQLISTEKNRLSKDPKSNKKLARQLSLVQNPWDVYKTQYEVLLNQFSEIENATRQLAKTVAIFESLKTVAATISKNNALLNAQLRDNIKHISNHIEDKDVKELSFFLDEQISHDVSLGTNQEVLTDALNDTINRLEKMKVPVGTDEGLLVIRDIDFNKTVQKWFDYQIVPEVMDLMAIETSLKSINGISLTNLRNSLQLSKNEENNTNTNTNSVLSRLTTLKTELEDLQSKGDHIIYGIEKKISSELQVANLLNGKPFLELPFNSSLQFDSESLLTKIKQPFEKGLSFFDTQLKKTNHHQASSDSELATECLHYRMFKQDSDHYDAIFQNKKFIGDLFLVPRQTQEELLKKTIEQWRKGFNKSALVYGERLSGRSTFLDYTANKYFGKHDVNLQPNSEATIDGRKFKTTNDLKQALQYIKQNNSQSTRPIIVIDDLELWRDSEHSLLSNVRALMSFIETESDDAFVMVSTSKMMMRHLDTRLAFSNAFSTVIDVSKTEKTQIKKALLMRHGAAHRVLIDENLEPLTEKTIQRNIANMSSRYHNNIGHVLQAWTYHTFVQENEKMLFKVEEEDFPDVFTQQELTILKQASLFKIVTELGLKHVTSTGYDTDYKSAVKRLVNMKALLRNTLGHLYINPVILNDVNLFINQRS